MEIMSEIKSVALTSPPCISIYVDDGSEEKANIDETTKRHNQNSNNSNNHNEMHHNSSTTTSSYLDQDDDGTKMNSNTNPNKMMKCKSMQNMKLVSSLIENERYKQNLDQFNNTNNNNNSQQCLSIGSNQVIPVIKTSNDRHLRHNYGNFNGGGHAIVPNYRKCLSRVNLNLYSSPIMVHSSSQHEDAAAANNNLRHPVANSSNQSANVATPKFIKINPIRAVKVRNFPINAVSIMNLENCVDNLGLDKISAVHSSRRNLLINKSYSNLANNLTMGFRGNKQPLFATTTTSTVSPNNLAATSGNPTTSCMLVNSSSSHLNLYKSSNSLNALDLDLMESVSVGSFDRLSLYSCGGANSECDLNQCYLVEMIDDSTSARLTRSRLNLIGNGTNAGGGVGAGSATSTTNTDAASKNRSCTSTNQLTNRNHGFSLIDPTLSLSNLKENRVIDWLENI